MRVSIILLICGVMLVSGCQASQPIIEPSPVVTPTETLTPTATIDWFPRTATPTLYVPKATATPAPTLIDPGYDSVLIENAFDDQSKWTQLTSKEGNITLEEQMLVLAIPDLKSELFSLSAYRLPADFFLEITVDVSLCSDDDVYGVAFWRFSEMGTHTFLLNCQGEFRIERLINTSLAVLKDWSVARRMKPGSPTQHKITIWAESGKVAFYVDGTHQYDLQVRSGLHGGLGLLARSGGNSPETVTFKDLYVTQP